MNGTDHDLLACMAQGSPADGREALAALYARHAGAVLRFLVATFHNPHDAEDVLQETFLAANRFAHTFRSGDARPWLLTLASNRMRDLRRSGGRRSRRERQVSLPEGTADPAAELGAGADLEGHLAQLSNRNRTVIELRFVQKLPHSQAAQVLGVSLRTEKVWVEQAIGELRKLLGGDFK